MEHIFVVRTDFSPFDAERLDRIFRAEPEFRKVRRNLPAGCPLEGQYGTGDHSIQVALSENATAITLSWTSATALEAVLLLRRGLSEELRMFDSQYSFDLILRETTTLEELYRATDASRADEPHKSPSD